MTKANPKKSADLKTSSDPENSAPDRLATRLVHNGRRPEWTGTPDHPGAMVNPPIWRGSTHLHQGVAEMRAAARNNQDGQFHYGRRGAPTQWALAEALSDMEPGAKGTMLYPSGLAAIAGALLAFLSPGDELLISDNSYDPTRSLANGLLKRMNINIRYFASDIGADIAKMIGANTKVIWLESPGSLTMEVSDIATICSAAKAVNPEIITMLDNTWASGYWLRALEQGCDLSILACTKYISGHSDVMLGSVTANARCWKALRTTAQMLGQYASADDCWLALRGLRTLDIRMKQHHQSALAIALWLDQQPQIAKVLHPALPDHPGHEFFNRDFDGACGLFSFIFKGGSDEARTVFIESLKLFGLGYSWGGFESLALPADPMPIRSASSWPPAGYDPADKFLVRLHIGLEACEDLIADLANALGQWQQQSQSA